MGDESDTGHTFAVTGLAVTTNAECNSPAKKKPKKVHGLEVGKSSCAFCKSSLLPLVDKLCLPNLGPLGTTRERYDIVCEYLEKSGEIKIPWRRSDPCSDNKNRAGRPSQSKMAASAYIFHSDPNKNRVCLDCLPIFDSGGNELRDARLVRAVTKAIGDRDLQLLADEAANFNALLPVPPPPQLQLPHEESRCT